MPHSSSGPNPPAQPAASSQRVYYPALDGVRAIAFLLVFVFHAGLLSLASAMRGAPGARGMATAFEVGSYGLTLFFALSAYLVTKLLLVERERTGRIAPGGFLLRRTLRIWPLYFALLLCVALATAVFGQMPGAGPLGARDFLFLGTFQGDFLRMFGPSTILTPLWSLAVEEKFYVLWPFLLLLLDRRGVAMMGAGLIVLATAWRLGSGHLADAVVAFCPLTHADAFGAGILLSLLPERPLDTGSRLVRSLGRQPWAALLVLVGGFILAELSRKAVVRLGLPSQAFAPGIAAGAAVFFLYLVAPLQTTWITSKPMVELGKRSYAAYLFHIIPVYAVISLAPGRGFGILVVLQMVGLALTLALAWISYRYLETPFLRLKKRFERVPSREI